MAQALSTFNASELLRFEAFRRSALRGDAVARHVAFGLAEHRERRYALREGTRSLMGAASAGVGSAASHGGRCGMVSAGLRWDPTVSDYRGAGGGGGSSGGGSASVAADLPDLADLVAPNTAQEITVVVSTLAKCYAQRLVTAARRVASVGGHPDGERLLPGHISEAHRHRSLAGIDPGFFLRPATQSRVLRGPGSGWTARGEASLSASAAAALGVPDRHAMRYCAALRAQEDYDRRIAEEEEEIEKVIEKEEEEEKERPLLQGDVDMSHSDN